MQISCEKGELAKCVYDGTLPIKLNQTDAANHFARWVETVSKDSTRPKTPLPTPSLLGVAQRIMVRLAGSQPAETLIREAQETLKRDVLTKVQGMYRDQIAARADRFVADFCRSAYPAVTANQLRRNEQERIRAQTIPEEAKLEWKD